MRSLFRNHSSSIRHPELVSGSLNVFSRTSFSSRITVLFLSLLFSFSVFAQPPRPSPQRAVNNLSVDLPDYLSANETAELERRLENFSNETTNQICVVIVDSLWGFSTADLAERILTTWGVGMKGKNNGVVILIKPTGGAGERDAFIGTGYGLEGAIPDGVCKKIVDNELIPGLKAGDPYKGINDAVTVLMALAKGDYNEKDYRKKVGRGGKDLFSWSNLLILIVVIVIISRIFKKSGFSSYTGAGRYMGGGGFGGFGGGFGGGSSGGGGGWGGFGGGSGGGGGAGGKW